MQSRVSKLDWYVYSKEMSLSKTFAASDLQGQMLYFAHVLDRLSLSPST